MGGYKEQILLAQQGDKEAFEKLVENNTGLVHAVLRRFYHRSCDMEDLFQIGVIGLMKAIRRFDLQYDVAFSTYAVPMIIGEIKRFLRQDGMIKVSRTIRENGYKIVKCKEKLSQELGREPRVYEIAQAVDLTEEEVVIAMEAGSEVESIYQPAYPGVEEENYLIDQINEGQDKQEEIFTSLFLEWGLDQLEEKERQLITMRYFQDMTQSQVAEKLHMSQVSVSRLERKILNSLKKKME